MNIRGTYLKNLKALALKDLLLKNSDEMLVKTYAHLKCFIMTVCLQESLISGAHIVTTIKSHLSLLFHRASC